jgi:hypothetical protein
VSILFNATDTSAYIEHMPQHLRASIDSEPEDYLLNASETDLVAYYISKYRLDVPDLDNKGIYLQDRGEVLIDMSGQSGRYFSAPGEHHRKGTQITIAVPFSGDADLFTFHPSQFTFNSSAFVNSSQAALTRSRGHHATQESRHAPLLRS